MGSVSATIVSFGHAIRGSPTKRFSLKTRSALCCRATSSFKKSVKIVPRSLPLILSHRCKQSIIRASRNRRSAFRSCCGRSSTAYKSYARSPSRQAPRSRCVRCSLGSRSLAPNQIGKRSQVSNAIVGMPSALFVGVRQHSNERAISKYPVMDKRGGSVESRENHQCMGENFIHLLYAMGQGTVLEPWRWNLGQTK